MRSKRILAVVKARNREFYRDKAGLGWNILMPFAMIFGFAFLFSGGPKDLFRVGVLGEPSPGVPVPFLALRHIRFIPVADERDGIDKVRHHRLDLLLDLRGTPRYWVNDQSANGYILERLLHACDADTQRPPIRESVSGRPVRYVDWVLPGVLALNMTLSSLWGVGWVIVRYRKNGVLRRLRATPLTALEFLVAQVLSRLIVVLVVTLVVFVGTRVLLDVPMRGSYAALLLIFVAGALCMISVGLLVASRLGSEELADGLLNLISWPMMLLSGVWFSMDGTRPLARLASQAFPLTHLVEAARRIMLDGAGMLDIAPQVLLLGGTGCLLLILAARLFRWQ